MTLRGREIRVTLRWGEGGDKGDTTREGDKGDTTMGEGGG